MIRVRPRTAADERAVGALLAATADRVEALDPRVRLARRPLPGDGALVAVDDAGAVRGHVRGVPEELAADDESRLYAADRSVTWTEAAVDGPAAVEALAGALRRPGGPGAEADAVLWPAADGQGAGWWAVAGLEPAGKYALRPPEPLPAEPPPGVTIRAATPDDVDAVAALHRDAVAFQAAVSPYVREVPAAEAGFRRRLLDGRSSTQVADRDGELLGMAEWWVTTAEAEHGRAAVLPPGRYAYLNSVGVRFDARGDGLGRALAGAVLAAAGPGLAGSTLWFSVHNPVAGGVWPHLGWQPLWTMWERRTS